MSCGTFRPTFRATSADRGNRRVDGHAAPRRVRHSRAAFMLREDRRPFEEFASTPPRLPLPSASPRALDRTHSADRGGARAESTARQRHARRGGSHAFKDATRPITNVGRPSSAARCMGPESLAITARAARSVSTSSRSQARSTSDTTRPAGRTSPGPAITSTRCPVDSSRCLSWAA